MSNEKVQKLLLAEQQKKAENDALMRYKVLSHFGLGKVEYFRQGENYDDYPIIQNNTRLRYDCDISDEDFEKVYEIYKKQVDLTVKPETKDGAEKTLSVCAIILLIVGILTLVVTVGSASAERDFNWTLFGIGIGVVRGDLGRLRQGKMTALESGKYALGSHGIEASKSGMRFQFGKGHGKQ